MASSTDIRRRSKTEESSASSSKITTRIRGQSVDLDWEDRSRQLQEPLLTQGTDDSIALVPKSDVHSAPEEGDSGLRYRKRAKRWRKGMRLPKERSRRKTVYDKFIDSSKNTPHYVKDSAIIDNVLL